jgi:hypothetical protein
MRQLLVIPGREQSERTRNPETMEWLSSWFWIPGSALRAVPE